MGMSTLRLGFQHGDPSILCFLERCGDTGVLCNNLVLSHWGPSCLFMIQEMRISLNLYIYQKRHYPQRYQSTSLKNIVLPAHKEKKFLNISRRYKLKLSEKNQGWVFMNIGLLSAKVAASSNGQNTKTSLLFANVNQIFAAYNLFSAQKKMPAESFTTERQGQIVPIMKKAYNNDTTEKMYVSFTYPLGWQWGK